MTRNLPHDEAPSHEFEAEHGLPQPLPADERILWQGAPDGRLMARGALHWRLFAGYFAVLLAARGATVLAGGGGAVEAATSVAGLVPLAVLALGLIGGFAWLVGRTSVYTITDRRVVMRIGVVLSVTFNLPHARIASAGLRCDARDGSGEIALALEGDDRIAYLHLWPHARPWRLKRAEPMLRGLRDARGVAGLLAGALAASAGRTSPVGAPAAWPAGVIDGRGDRPRRDPQPLAA